MLVRVLSALVAAGGFGAWLAKRIAGARAQRLLDEGLAQIEQALVDNLGGAATVTVDGEPLPVLLGLQDQELPAGTIEMEHFRLPNGLAVRHATLSTAGGDDAGHLVARVSSRAISEQLGMPGVRVHVQDGRLRLVLGVASVTVRVRVDDGRVVLWIPSAPPPLGAIVSDGLTELVPHPPPGVELHDVAVEGRELVIRAIVDMQRLADLAQRQHGR
jgi:hypothetical protein